MQLNVKMRQGHRSGWRASILHPLSSILIFLALCLMPSVARAQTGAPYVATDQADYPPGGLVLISGGGFASGETVQLQVLHIVDGTNDNSTSPAHQPWQVTADADGNFTSNWDVPFDEDEAGATLQLTAVGQTSGLTAQATF